MGYADISAPLPLRQVNSPRLFEEICDQIRKRIASGVLRPGDRLPAERDMAAGFRVSRPAVREAMRALENAGVVRMVKGAHGGAYILPPSTDVLTRSMQDLMNLGGITLPQLAEARIAVHEQVLKLACERRTEADLAALEETLRVLDTSGDLHERAEAGARFFTLIANATGNEALGFLVDSLTRTVREVMADRTPRARPELQPLRRRILKGLRERDAESALRAMNAYVRIVHAVIDREAGPAQSRQE